MNLHPESFAGPRAFARWALKDGRLLLRPLPDQLTAWNGLGQETVLFRESCWQIELLMALPNAPAPVHRHLRCDSADLLLHGEVAGAVEGRGFTPPRGPLHLQLKTISRGEWHGGQAGPKGFVWLSFQRWHDGEPTFISEDWEAWPATA